MIIKITNPQAKLETPADHISDFMPLLERAARTCYRSDDKISFGSDVRLINMLIDRGHESVLEHCSITYSITCSRNCSHQLVRHRLAAYSQESMRYCDYKGDVLSIILPPKISNDIVSKLLYVEKCKESYMSYNKLREMGIPPEDARYILPTATKTEIVTTYNLRMWRHVLSTRCHKSAQWEIREIMNQISGELSKLLPTIFDERRM